MGNFPIVPPTFAEVWELALRKDSRYDWNRQTVDISISRTGNNETAVAASDIQLYGGDEQNRITFTLQPLGGPITLNMEFSIMRPARGWPRNTGHVIEVLGERGYRRLRVGGAKSNHGTIQPLQIREVSVLYGFEETVEFHHPSHPKRIDFFTDPDFQAPLAVAGWTDIEVEVDRVPIQVTPDPQVGDRLRLGQRNSIQWEQERLGLVSLLVRFSLPKEDGTEETLPLYYRITELEDEQSGQGGHVDPPEDKLTELEDRERRVESREVCVRLALLKLRDLKREMEHTLESLGDIV